MDASSTWQEETPLKLRSEQASGLGCPVTQLAKPIVSLDGVDTGCPAGRERDGGGAGADQSSVTLLPPGDNYNAHVVSSSGGGALGTSLKLPSRCDAVITGPCVVEDPVSVGKSCPRRQQRLGRCQRPREGTK